MTGSEPNNAPAFGLVHVLCVLSLILGGGLMVARSYPGVPPAAGASTGSQTLAVFQEGLDAPVAPRLGPRVEEGVGLPLLSYAAQQRIVETGGDRRLTIHGRRELSGEHDGVILLMPGAELIIDDLILRGALIAADSLSPIPVDTPLETVRVRGTLRIDPMDELPGLAMHLPYGRFETATSEARFQIDGDVIVEDIDVHAASGELLGRLATGSPARSQGNAPSARPRSEDTRWSTALQVNQPAPGTTATPAAAAEAPTDWDDVQDMLDFDFSSLPTEQDR